MISTEDFCWFVDQSLTKMVAILGELGDDRASTPPDLPGANSPFGIVTHCLGVMNAWAGFRVAGREIVRDREAEFRATGSVGELASRVEAAREQFQDDIGQAVLSAPLRHPLEPSSDDLPYARNQGAALMHVYEELSQHLGQMELSRDVLLSQS